MPVGIVLTNLWHTQYALNVASGFKMCNLNSLKYNYSWDQEPVLCVTGILNQTHCCKKKKI